MDAKFDYFVLFAEMRTGSNFVEANLNEIDGLFCHGEAFNPAFIGYPNRTEILGLTLDMREDDPHRLLTTIKDYSEGLGGFRFFHDHDPRVVDEILNDTRCAKIILTRNPADSYVSWKIAQATGQWKLTDGRKRRDAQAVFDEGEFVDHLQALQKFQVRILNTLQKSGQTAFYIGYEDMHDVDVMNGLAQFLGVDGRLNNISKKLKKQNPEPIEDKVQNFDKMEGALARLDQFNLSRTPNFEPRRGANVPDFIAAQGAPLLYMPVKGGPVDSIRTWMSKLGDERSGLISQFSQKSLRQWKRGNRGHRSFTVVRHPLLRAHEVFCTSILDDDGPFPKIRRVLRNRYKLPIPETAYDLAYDKGSHQEAFLGFLNWLQKNLAEQTSVRIDSHWASQSQVIQGFGSFALPDLIIRENDMAQDLTALATKVGVATPNSPERASQNGQFSLDDIYAPELEKAAQAAYSRDYMIFGFDKWRSD